ncbi:hypothetical protein [Tranquillimonas alkanivorans]|uniref:D-galactarate dehydratase n=1 Tax=Tranquillimonas alkanivorans TaxID=441119 RepID=A0A1I5SJ51_9RHOB|nr:hypothetical protein [Tranquillimonas alkanivorans]SFP70769.1 hypothetical protein SAMN04488047_11142 [Tranquillimonas alkanivorans]
MSIILRAAAPFVILFALSACASGPNGQGGEPNAMAAPPPQQTAAVAPPPPPAARTAEEFDTTTPEQRAAAAAPAQGGETRLGETVASLGDPGEPGLWIRTPLVEARQPGRIEYPATGKSAQVDLIPRDGPATAGSQVSLAALRLLEAPLTDLPTLVVYAQ